MRRESRTARRGSAWYALRRTLPTWSFQANLDELVEFLPRYRVDELIVKIDTEEFTHGQPALAWVRKYQKNLFRITEAMGSIGVVYSLNPWITVGHCDRGRDARTQLPGLQTTVGDDGTRCTSCACPLDPVWRRHVEKIWTLYAETHPRVMWVEDDIRTFNHEPVKFGCFCPLHMRRFGRLVGRRVGRQKLITALLKPGRPHPWRRVWLDMQRDVMNETVAFLAKVVHKVSPETSMGLMSSGPRAHVLDGRDWNSFAEALADGRPIYSRPPMANYSEGPLRGFYYSGDSIKITRSCMPAGTVEQTEVENVPYTRYANSVNFTFLEMAISFAFGSHGVTLNLFDHTGTPMADEPWYGRMLVRRKDFLNALAVAAQREGSFRGVRLLHHDRAAYVKRLTAGANGSHRALAEDGGSTGEMLESHGIATTYEDSNVIATSGQTLRAFSDEEIRDMLKRGMLLDAAAARVLFERGFGREIGLADIEPPRCIDLIEPLSAEELFNGDFGGAPKRFMTLTLPDLMGRPGLSVLTPARGAAVVSRMVDPDARPRYVGMYAFENRLGGRVVVHALELATAFGAAFCSPYRLGQLQSAVRWLSRGRPALLVEGGVYPLSLRKDCGGYSLLGIFNLTLDPWPNAVFTLSDARKPAGLRALGPSGRWARSAKLRAESRSGMHRIIYDGAVGFDEPLFVELMWPRAN